MPNEHSGNEKPALVLKPTPVSVFKRVGGGLKAYLTDWKNLLGHALLGLAFVAAAIWVPVPVWLKIVIIACLVALNVLRMRLKAKKDTEKESAT